MGILRADRITGLGGANAIKGSTKFSDNRLLEIHGAESNEDFRLSNGSFTIEFWAYVADTTNSTFVGLFENNPARRSWQFEARSDQALRFEWWTDGSSGTALTSSTGAFIRDRWQHFAVVRNGTALNIYVDGTSVANTTTSDTFYENTIEPLSIGGIFQSGALTQAITGFISNLRIIKGEAIYTANFTPPTSELTVTSNTVVLACQSPGNVFQEATGKTVVATTTSTNDAPPQASHFRPNSPVGFSTTSDVGSQYGSTFNGFGNFATSTYMVPPGGNTRERNRGRALWAGGDNPGGGDTNLIDFIQIQSGGIGFDFGDLTVAANQTRGVSSSTRGVFGGGRRPHPATTNTIDFVTIANTANAQDFGDLTDDRAGVGEISSSTRGIFAAGYNPSNTNTIDYVTIATLGNATDFGDTSELSNAIAGTQSTTRGILGGGNIPSSPNASNVIQYLTIATTGNTQDFGDLRDSRHSASGTSNGVRAVFMGGDHLSPAADNTIDYITIASTGDATDFGDLGSTSIGTGGATSDKIRGVFGLGYAGPNYLNVIQQVTIATTGNSVDIGELTLLRHQPGCLSDAHGGLE